MSTAQFVGMLASVGGLFGVVSGLLVLWLRAEFHRIDQRFDGVDQRFDGVDQRFNDLIHTLDRHLDTIDRRFGELREDLKGHVREDH